MSLVAGSMNGTSSTLRMERDMTLMEVEKMSARIIELISRQKSLAQATSYAYTHVGTNNPEDVAIQYMSPSELYQYRTSKKRGVPFSIDIERDRVETPDGAKQFPRMALALDRLFQTTGHTRENVAFIYRRYPGHISLVKAYLKLINAERDAISNADVTLDLFQEYQTCRKILGNAQYVFQHSPADEREQSVMIRKMQTLMERRMADLAGSKLRTSKRPTHSSLPSRASDTRVQCTHKKVPSRDNSMLPSPPSSPHQFQFKPWNIQTPKFEPYVGAPSTSHLPSSNVSNMQNSYELSSSSASHPNVLIQVEPQASTSSVSHWNRCDMLTITSAESTIKFDYTRSTSRFGFNNNFSPAIENTEVWWSDMPIPNPGQTFQMSYVIAQPTRSRFFPVP